MKRSYFVTSVICLIIFTSFVCHAEYRINFFVQTYPELGKAVDAQKIVNNATNPSKTAARILQANPVSQPFSGLFATYAGYVTASAPFNGQISFPRKQQNPFFYLVVTPRITPVMMLGATVHHWELIQGLPAAFYTVDRKQDPDTKRYFWSTRHVDVPTDGIVPLSSIVLFAKPKHIYLPLGITPTNDNPQLLLPNVYVKGGTDLVAGALRMLNVKHFFRSLQSEHKKGTAQSLISQMP